MTPLMTFSASCAKPPFLPDTSSLTPPLNRSPSLFSFFHFSCPARCSVAPARADDIPGFYATLCPAPFLFSALPCLLPLGYDELLPFFCPCVATARRTQRLKDSSSRVGSRPAPHKILNCKPTTPLPPFLFPPPHPPSPFPS
eukprot:RCo052208